MYSCQAPPRSGLASSSPPPRLLPPTHPSPRSCTTSIDNVLYHTQRTASHSASHSASHTSHLPHGYVSVARLGPPIAPLPCVPGGRGRRGDGCEMPAVDRRMGWKWPTREGSERLTVQNGTASVSHCMGTATASVTVTSIGLIALEESIPSLALSLLTRSSSVIETAA